MKPSIGRIVRYRDRDGRFHPAIISAVHEDTPGNLVNLRVFQDDSGTPWWITSCAQGDDLGQWSWPPRSE